MYKLHISYLRTRPSTNEFHHGSLLVVWKRTHRSAEESVDLFHASKTTTELSNVAKDIASKLKSLQAKQSKLLSDFKAGLVDESASDALTDAGHILAQAASVSF